MEELGLLEAIYTTRAIRKFRPDPVPMDVLRKVLEAATQAPSGRNSQPWRFIVVDDPQIKLKIGEMYKDGYTDGGKRELPTEDEDPSVYLANHFGEAPVLIVPTARYVPRPPAPGTRALTLPIPGAVFPAIQNLLLAARAYGLGGVLTVNHEPHLPAVKELLGIPEEVHVFGIVPLGYPLERHGRKTRKPVDEVTFYNVWEAPLPGA